MGMVSDAAGDLMMLKMAGFDAAETPSRYHASRCRRGACRFMPATAASRWAQVPMLFIYYLIAPLTCARFAVAVMCREARRFRLERSPAWLPRGYRRASRVCLRPRSRALPLARASNTLRRWHGRAAACRCAEAVPRLRMSLMVTCWRVSGGRRRDAAEVYADLPRFLWFSARADALLV